MEGMWIGLLAGLVISFCVVSVLNRQFKKTDAELFQTLEHAREGVKESMARMPSEEELADMTGSQRQRALAAAGVVDGPRAPYS